MGPRWTVYSHTHVASGRRYVGLTKKTMLFRWNQHVANARAKRGKGCAHFWAAIRKYGKDAFSHEVLEVCETVELANAAEERWIEKLGTRDPSRGFNLAKGGQHIPNSSSSTSEKLSAATRASMTPERRAFLSSLRKGVSLSEETKAKISASAMAHSSSIAARNRLRGRDYFVTMRNSMNKDILSKIHDSNRGRPVSAETRAKLSLAGTGRVLSQETKAKISVKSRNPCDSVRKKLSEAGRKGASVPLRGPGGKFARRL